jgi:hypothetical protein
MINNFLKAAALCTAIIVTFLGLLTAYIYANNITRLFCPNDIVANMQQPNGCGSRGDLCAIKSGR